MDWRYNTIWFEQLEQSKLFQIDLKEQAIGTTGDKFRQSEYANIWYLKKQLCAFDSLPASENLLYLQLNSANITDFTGIEKYGQLKRLELHYCTKVLGDTGLQTLCNSLEFLHINQSKKFHFTDQLLKLNKLRVLFLNTCAPVENLNFLSHFPNLIDFRFVNTNVLDGDLRPLLEHPTLRSVGFLDKRHYNLKSDYITEYLRKKNTSEYRTIVNKGPYQTFRYDYEQDITG